MNYKIEADNAHDAAAQFLEAFRKANPQLTFISFDYHDGSKITIRVKNKPVNVKPFRRRILD
jgi:hypothetical protein